MEFIVCVKDKSPSSLSKLDIVVPHIVNEIEDMIETFEDHDLFDNQVYTNGFELIDANNKKYKIDGIEANLATFTSNKNIKDNYTEIRIKFDGITSGSCRAFRLKMAIPKFAKIYKSLGVFELSLYYAWALSSDIDTMREFGVNGIPINRKLCEIWVTLPKDTLCGKAIPTPQQIKVKHLYQILSNKLLDTPRSAVYWDCENPVFDLPGRPLGDLIKPGSGVRIYCETTRPHISAETFEEKMGASLQIMDKLKDSALEAENSLDFIRKHGKKSFTSTLILSAIAIIISALALYKSW